MKEKRGLKIIYLHVDVALVFSDSNSLLLKFGEFIKKKKKQSKVNLKTYSLPWSQDQNRYEHVFNQ